MEINEKGFGFIQGQFSLSIKENGNETVVVNDKNTIVNNSFRILSDLLSGKAGAVGINRLVLGEGGVFEGNIQLPRATDSKLYTQTFSVEGWDEILVNTVNEFSITFIKRIGFDEGNGIGAALYNEAGLFAGNVMFARKTFPEQIKTPDREFLIKWTLINKI